MALIEGFESLSGTPAKPTGWSDPDGTAVGSPLSVTQGAQSWQWSGTVGGLSRHDSNVTNITAGTGTTIISIDVDVVSLSDVVQGVRLIVERPASKNTAQDSVAATGATTLDVDISAFAGLDGLTIRLAIDAGVNPVIYVLRWDNLRDNSVGGGGAGKINLGNVTINKIYLGATQINKVYLGTSLVHDTS